MDDVAEGYEAPTISDYGSLLEMTAHKGGRQTEDGCGKTDDGNFNCSTAM